MPKATTAAGGSKNFKPVSEGVVSAVCVDVVDLGSVKSPFKNEDGTDKFQHKVKVVWQVDEARDDGKLFTVSKQYTLSLHEKAKLRSDLQSWRGKSFTEEELEAGFEVEDVKGWHCLLNIQHETKNEKTYANIVSIMPLPKGFPKLDPDGTYKRWVPKATANQTAGEDTEADDDVPF